jgi:hypothetical protein
LWLEDRENKDAPNFWINPEKEEEIPPKTKSDKNTKNANKLLQDQKRIKQIEKLADLLISTSSDDVACEKHESPVVQDGDQLHCDECGNLREKFNKYQNHKHTFTCAKKKKTISIKETEGHGRLSGFIKGPELNNIPVCRFWDVCGRQINSRLYRCCKRNSKSQIFKCLICFCSRYCHGFNEAQSQRYFR